MPDDDDDLPSPPPGGFLRDPGPAGPEEAEQANLERIANAVEGVRDELERIRQLLDRLAAAFGK